VYNCFHHRTPRKTLWTTVFQSLFSDVVSRQHIRSARRHYIVVPPLSLSSYECQTFAVVDPTAWNSPSNDLHDPTLSTYSFRRLLKTQFISEYKSIHWITIIALYAIYKFTCHLLTYCSKLTVHMFCRLTLKIVHRIQQRSSNSTDRIFSLRTINIDHQVNPRSGWLFA